MSEKQRVFESELQLVKAPKMAPKPKPEDVGGKGSAIRREQSQRKFSRDTVVRLINWFKQD